MPGKKPTARGWKFANETRGWQQSDDFFRQYPTRALRREFYEKRQQFYKDVRDGKINRQGNHIKHVVIGKGVFELSYPRTQEPIQYYKSPCRLDGCD